MRQYGFLSAVLLVALAGSAVADTAGYQTVVSQPDGSLIISTYSDSAVLLDSFPVPVGDPRQLFASPLVTNTVYLSSTSFSNALPATSTIIPENFNSPANLSYSEPLINSNCDGRLGDCSNPPPPFLPITASADGSSISGNVGDCSGVPRCLSPTGWEYGYIVDLHFPRPIVGLAVTAGLMPSVNLSTLFYDISLPTDDLFAFGIGGSPDFNGWVFPAGVSDVYLNYYGLPSNSHNGMFGPMPFTLSNFEIALGPVVPEPSTVFLSVTGLLAIGLIARRHARG